MKISKLIFMALLLFVTSCFDTEKKELNQLGHTVLIQHRPYSYSYNVSKEIRDFLQKTLGHHTTDNMTTSLEEFIDQASSQQNLIVHTESFSGHYGNLSTYYTAFPSRDLPYTTLTLFENETDDKKNALKDKVAFYSPTSTLSKAKKYFNFNSLFSNYQIGPTIEAIKNLSSAKEYRYLITETSLQDNPLLTEHFDSVSTSPELYESTWLISNKLVKILEQREILSKFITLLHSSPFKSPTSINRAGLARKKSTLAL